MKTRIRQVRTDAKLNQDDFAARIGLSKNFVSLVETGGREPSDRTIKDICREFSVNETWLRTGEGDPYGIDRETQEVVEYLSHAITHNVTKKDTFLRKIATMDDKMLEAALQFMEAIVLEEKQK